jgi:hypothetical protein
MTEPPRVPEQILIALPPDEDADGALVMDETPVPVDAPAPAAPDVVDSVPGAGPPGATAQGVAPGAPFPGAVAVPDEEEAVAAGVAEDAVAAGSTEMVSAPDEEEAVAAGVAEDAGDVGAAGSTEMAAAPDEEDAVAAGATEMVAAPDEEEAVAAGGPADGAVADDEGAAPAPGPIAAARADAGVPFPPEARAADARLARLHLRGGLISLARAELEQMAGIGALDREALADLAEARWRSGDLEGAYEAANAHLGAGGTEPIAHLIVAEQADRDGRLVEARRHAAVVRERVGPGLDRLFAGEPRSTAWPVEALDWMDARAGAPGRWGLLVGGREVAEATVDTWPMLPPPGVPATQAAGAVTIPVVASSALALTDPTAVHSVGGQLELGLAAGTELAVAEAELEAGELRPALARLALVLRFDGALAPVILSLTERVVPEGVDDPWVLLALHLLRGDACRDVGLELEASDAYREALRVLEARTTQKEPS